MTALKPGQDGHPVQAKQNSEKETQTDPSSATATPPPAYMDAYERSMTVDPDIYDPAQDTQWDTSLSNGRVHVTVDLSNLPALAPEAEITPTESEPEPNPPPPPPLNIVILIVGSRGLFLGCGG